MVAGVHVEAAVVSRSARLAHSVNDDGPLGLVGAEV